MDSDKKENQVAHENGVHTENSSPAKKVDNAKESPNKLVKPGKCSSWPVLFVGSIFLLDDRKFYKLVFCRIRSAF